VHGVPSVTNRYTGLFRAIGPSPTRAHDPDVAVWAATIANRPWPAADAVGGAGWTDDAAERACIGEAIERWHTAPLPGDRVVRATYARWPLAERAIDPARFVRFHRDQHVAGFPFEPLVADSEVEWVACRALATGEPIWAPADLVFLELRTAPRFGPTISTGWAAHATPQAAVAAAVHELVERDALVGAWWGRYPLHELATHALPPELAERIARPNLRWRWFRIVTPLSPHVTLATLEGEDREGYVFSIGSACRGDRGSSLEKATLEAVQGRHYVRHLLATLPVPVADDLPASFAEHAAYYSRHRAALARTCLASAERRDDDAPPETFAQLVARVPPLAFRLATPPALVDRGHVVVRVIAPELQPLHGDHRLPFLGGPLWDRPIAAWADMPPHPFA
jgi:ribosomal protein S12 methylthiotransferase accessory factor